MPFIPHTKNDVQAMLHTIGATSIETLFDEIPLNIRAKEFERIPEALTEMEMLRLMGERSAQDHIALNFIGAGAYEHHIPAIVWDIATRGEFMTCYTPYQAEASQGTLQLLYEYQTMMANLTGMEVSNASLYDGASALAEAILMAVRLHKSPTKGCVLIPKTVHPYYRATAKTLVEAQGINLIEVPLSSDGHCDPKSLDDYQHLEIIAVVIPQTNFLGVVEEFDALTDWAHKKNALAIAVINPLALALFKEPGSWGTHGVDIACGELQPFGIPLSSGGPYAGFMCCKQQHIRQMPGRIIGATVDKEGKRGFTLTLQAREQHIRRAKATSNICTNQGLLVTAATIYMSVLGFEGLKRVAAQCHANATSLLKKLLTFPGVTLVFTRPFFHEIVVRFDRNVEDILIALAKENILAGYALAKYYPGLENCLLLCATETKTEKDLQLLIEKLGEYYGK
jgi:glycine dehydrogenase subunit 1